MIYRTLTTEELIKHAQHLQNSPDAKMSPALFEEVLNRLIQHPDSQDVIDSLEDKIEKHEERIEELEERIEELEEEVLEYRQKIRMFKLQLEDILADLE